MEPLGNVDEVMIRYVPMLEPRCEWVQIADIDEYVYLGGKKIDEVMAEHEALKEVHWRWLMMPSNAKASTRNDINYVASSSGLMTTTPSDASVDEMVPGDIATAQAFGKRVAEVTAKLFG